jgi:hypothetical protein
MQLDLSAIEVPAYGTRELVWAPASPRILTRIAPTERCDASAFMVQSVTCDARELLPSRSTGRVLEVPFPQLRPFRHQVWTGSQVRATFENVTPRALVLSVEWMHAPWIGGVS